MRMTKALLCHRAARAGLHRPEGNDPALERVARDSARDHPTVMEVLTAFIREHSRERGAPSGPGNQEQVRSTRSWLRLAT